MRDLHVGRGVTWPAVIGSQAIGVLGMRGAGKSNLGRVIAEELFASSVPFVVFDPIGNWYGIRAGRDGQPGGGIPVPIFGGEHGDVQLDRNSGQKIADLVLDRRLSCVLDLSHADFSETDKRKFLVDFGERLFRRKSRESGWLTLIMEEADDYAPQQVHGGEREGSTARTLGMFQRLVKRGRFKGLGALLITQRSAAINKDLLYMVGTLIAFRTTGPRDQDAVGGWVKYNAIGEKVLESLPTLEDGEAWVIAPEALGKIERTRFRRMATYDTGSTPEHGGQAKPATLADIDVPALTKELADAVERAKAEDPRELRKTIADLRAQLAKKAVPAAALTKAPKTIEKPVLTAAQIKRMEAVAARMVAEAERHGKAMADFWKNQDEVNAALLAALRSVAEGHAPPPQRPALHAVPPRPAPAPVVQRAPVAARRSDGAEGLEANEQRILDTVSMLYLRGLPVTREAVARWQGLHPNGGRFNRGLARLREGGYLDGFRLTVTGNAAAHELETGTAALLAALPDEGHRKVMREILAAGAPISREVLAERLSLHPNGGRYNRTLAWLRDMGVIPERGAIEATEGAHR